jgi:hypothetical protein
LAIDLTIIKNYIWLFVAIKVYYWLLYVYISLTWEEQTSRTTHMESDGVFANNFIYWYSFVPSSNSNTSVKTNLSLT